MAELFNKASTQDAEPALREALSCFRNRDKDIETFLHSKATTYEKRGWCTVYLLLDRDKFKNGEICVEAYFTLSHKSVTLVEGVAGEMRKDITGFRKGKDEENSTPVVLIGQLGKYISGKRVSKLSCEDILRYAFFIIGRASDLIVCRSALVECGDEEKVHDIYKRNGFKHLQYDGSHYQLYRKVDRMNA